MMKIGSGKGSQMGPGRKEGNILFNGALNTFYLRLYGVRHMVKNHSDRERGNPLPPHGLFFPISQMGPSPAIEPPELVPFLYCPCNSCSSSLSSLLELVNV